MRGEPTLWRLATEYLFIRKLAPRSRLLNPLYVGGFDHDEETEADWLYGPALLVRRDAVDAVGMFDEAFFMFSEEVDWMTRFRRAGWKVLFFPGAEVVHVGGASHGGQMYVENLRGHLRFFAKHDGPKAAERARVLLLWSLRLRALVLRREAYREGDPLPLVRQRSDADPVIEYLRLAFGTVLVLLPGLALGRTMSEVVAWTMGALFVAWTVVFTVHSNIKVAALVLLVLFVAALVARRRLAIERRRPGGAIALGIVLGWFLWHTAGAVVGDGLFHEARVRKLVALRRPAPPHGRRVQGRRAASRLRVPALARARRARRVVLGPRSVGRHAARGARSSRRSQSRSPTRQVSRSSARAPAE